jgi:hypothetical protein
LRFGVFAATAQLTGWATRFGGGGTPYSKDMDFASCILWLNALEGIIGRDRRLVLWLGRMSRRIDNAT